MSFRVRTERLATSSGLDGTVVVLEDGNSGSRAEIWPALGFNCYRWQVLVRGQPCDLLYADPDLFHNGRPTRSGIPVLFPFPNRIRDGRFTWEGKTYQLPQNDSTQRNAIHGFACRRPWRMVAQGAADDSAWVRGEFHGAVDAPDSLALWPSDYRMRLTYRLTAERLAVEAVVDNPGSARLPFGLGYHPYFRVPLTPGGSEATCQLQAEARELWELRESLPTGTRLALDRGHDLRTPRALAGLQLDDVYTGLECPQPTPGKGLCLRGRVIDQSGPAELQVLTAPAFRELVLFTPPHRQAVCLEPYTCTTDAINLQQQGKDAGLLTLEPGQQWMGEFQMRWLVGGVS